MMRIRSPSLFLLSTWSFTCFIGWFVIEIISHSESGTVYQFSEESNQLFIYTTLLCLASVSSCWYADFARTRASRAAAATITTFTTFAWIWNLWFVIPAFEGSSNSLNQFCNSNYSSIWCQLTRAAAAFSVAMAFGLCCNNLFAWFTYLTSITPEIPIPTQATLLAPRGSNVAAAESGAHNADVNWRTELTEPDDLEIMKIAAINPYTHGAVGYRTSMMGNISSFFTLISLIGWIVLTLCLIEPAIDVGILGWDTTEANNTRLGDPIVAANWYWLSFTLGLSLAVSSYSSHRRNRGIIGGAYLVAVISTMQWFSLLVYSLRRVSEQSSRSNDSSVISSTGFATNSQFCEAAAIGLIGVGELLKCAILLVRYMTYMIVSRIDHDRVHVPSHVDAPTVVIAEKDQYNPNVTTEYDGTSVVQTNQPVASAPPVGDVANPTPQGIHQQEMNVPGPSYDPQDADVYQPSYNMSIFHGASIGFMIIFVLQAITLFGWFIMQLIAECLPGLFSQAQTTASDPYGLADSNNDRGYYYNEWMFLLSSILVLGAWIPAFFAEREVSVASAVASVYTSTLMCFGFFLLVWPFAYQSIYTKGTLYLHNGSGGMWLNFTQASGVFAMVNAFFILCVFVHSIVRLAERRAMITTWERNRQNIPSSLAWLMVCGVGVWSFTTLYFGLYSRGVGAQIRNSGTSNTQQLGADALLSYYASQAFLIFSAVATSTWVGCYASKLLYAWQSWAWRMSSFFLSLVTAAFLVPLLIYACRFINNSSLSNAELALVAGIIVLAGGAILYLASFSFLIHSVFYSVGLAGAAIPPTGMALRSNEQFLTTKQEQGLVAEGADYNDGVPASTVPYTKTTTYETTKDPAVNPRTGDVTVIEHTVPVSESTTTVDEPVTYETHTSYNGPANTVDVDAIPNEEIRYHDY